MEFWRFIIFGAFAFIGGTLSSYVDEVEAGTLSAKIMKFLVNQAILLVFLFFASAALVGWTEAVETVKFYLSGDFDKSELLILNAIAYTVVLLVNMWRRK